MSLLGIKKHQRPAIVAVGLFGAALIYGDGAITPAISVLSALEGLNIATPILKPYVLPGRWRFLSRFSRYCPSARRGLAVLGAALLYGDGAITPAISVLSALEGLKLPAPAIAPYIVPLSVIVSLIVAGLFLAVDLCFVAANMMKLFEGGWVPIVVAATVFFLMWT
jgi:K+ transporter